MIAGNHPLRLSITPRLLNRRAQRKLQTPAAVTSAAVWEAWKKMAAPKFLNLDVVLKSNASLDALVAYLGESVMVLSHHEHERQFTLVLELADQVDDAQSCTQLFLSLIDALPDAAMKLWKVCTSRTFSYGFDSGANHPALDTTISADLLRRIAAIDADIEITVYPVHQAQAPPP